MAEPSNLPIPDDREDEYDEHAPLGPEVVDRFLRVQMAEMEVRRAEVELQRENQSRSWDHAGRLLEAQLQDRSEQRSHSRRSLVMVFVFLAFIVLSIIGLVCYLLYLGKDELVEEIIKAILYVSLGGAGGYGASEHKRRKDAEKNPVDQ